MLETRENKPDTIQNIAANSGKLAATQAEIDTDAAADVNNFVKQLVTQNLGTAESLSDSKSWRQQYDKRADTKIWLSTEKANTVTGIPERTLRDQCGKGEYISRVIDADAIGRGKLEILLDSLPALAQANYYIDLRKPSDSHPAPSLLVDMDEREALWERFYAASGKLQMRARNASAAVIEFNRLLDTGTARMQAYAAIQAKYEVSRNTLNGYLTACERFDRMDWAPRLLPTYKGTAPRLFWHPDAWEFFLRHALTPRAKVNIAYRRTVEEGQRQGWPPLPNIKTARQAINDLPQTVVALVKEGPTALKRLAPTAMRDYTTFALHEVWSMDGRKLDLAVIDTKGRFGEKGRLLRVWLYAFLDFRSRYVVGYAISATLDADLVRAAFLDALKTTGRIIPQRIAPDNGMEIAAKEHTGGAAWTRRGGTHDNDIVGTFPQLGILIDWAMVEHGQTKPIERKFRTLSENLETLPEFRGAYLGSNSVDRPEECERSKAVPLELVEKRLAEELAAYHRTPHRGHGMDGKSPEQVYHELMRAPDFIPRQITEAQRMMCALSRKKITIRANGTFVIHGAVYYSMKTAELLKGAGYWATYNPHDLAQPVTVYKTTDGKAKKLAENVPQIQRTPGNSKEAGKNIMRQKAVFNKAVKAQAKALGAIQSAESDHIAKLSAEKFPEIVDKETGEILPVSKVVEMVRNKAEPSKQPTPSEAEETARILKLAREIEDVNIAESRKHAVRR